MTTSIVPDASQSGNKLRFHTMDAPVDLVPVEFKSTVTFAEDGSSIAFYTPIPIPDEMMGNMALFNKINDSMHRFMGELKQQLELSAAQNAACNDDTELVISYTPGGHVRVMRFSFTRYGD